MFKLKFSVFHLSAVLSLQLYFSSCSLVGTKQNNIQIESLPAGATITSVSDNGQVTTLGTTPLTISEQKLFNNSNFVQLQASLPGYKDNTIHVPKLDRLNQAALTFKLSEQSFTDSKKTEQFTDLINEIARVQSLIHQKK